MSNEFEELKTSWKSNKQHIKVENKNIEALISEANDKKRSSIFFHYGNIAVLTLTLIAIAFTINQWLPFEHWLSKAGVTLMELGLSVRIIIEVYSVTKSHRINFHDSTLINTNKNLEFYNFRKRIHGPVTIIIVAFYTIGFSMTLPELSLYLSTGMMIYIITSYIIGAAFLIWQIRKGIVKEMKNLNYIINFKDELNK